MIRRGEVRWARLPDTPAAQRHPVLVISSDAFNASRVATVQGIVMTSRLGLADAPGNVLVASSVSGLPRDAVVNVAQIVTLNRRCVGKAVGMVPAKLMAKVAAGLALAQGLRMT